MKLLHVVPHRLLAVTPVLGLVLVGACAKSEKSSAPVSRPTVQVSEAPTAAQRCSALQTYQKVIGAIDQIMSPQPTLRRPLSTNDFSSPMVERVDRDAMSVECSATLFVPAPPQHSSCAGPNFRYLEDAEAVGDSFKFRIR